MGNQTYKKRQKELARQQKRRDKAARRQQRKSEKRKGGPPLEGEDPITGELRLLPCDQSYEFFLTRINDNRSPDDFAGHLSFVTELPTGSREHKISSYSVTISAGAGEKLQTPPEASHGNFDIRLDGAVK